MEIPILLGVDGEARQIIETYHAGLYFEPEDKIDFQEKLQDLLSDEILYKECKAGCRKLSTDFDRSLLAEKMLQIITQFNG